MEGHAAASDEELAFVISRSRRPGSDFDLLAIGRPLLSGLARAFSSFQKIGRQELAGSCVRFYRGDRQQNYRNSFMGIMSVKQRPRRTHTHANTHTQSVTCVASFSSSLHHLLSLLATETDSQREGNLISLFRWALQNANKLNVRIRLYRRTLLRG